MQTRFTRRALVRAIMFGMAATALGACGGGGSGRSGGTPGTPSEPGPGPAPCPQPEPGGAQPPRGVHASWNNGDVHGTRTLTWFTDGTSDPGTLVEYGPVTEDMDDCALNSAPFPHQVTGTSHPTYGVEALTHVATITGLQAGQAVRYRVGSVEGGWSAVKVLKPTHEGHFRFCHFGDQGLGEASERVMRSVQAADPEFYIIAGDVAYADGDQPVWDRYFDFQEPYASHTPMMTCPGNHENKDGLGQGYMTRFSQPGRNTYYGFDYNRVHFFFSTGGSLLKDLNTAGDLLEELGAMEKDLAEAYKRRQNGEIDFIVVVQHYTIYTNNKGRNPGNVSLILLEEGMIRRYEVDLLLVGHDHIFERSHPMKGGLKAEDGYVQLTQGGGGRHLYELIDKPAGWAAVSRVCHGYSVLDVGDRQIRVRSYAVGDETGQLLADGEDQLIDEFVLSPRVRLSPGGMQRRMLMLDERPPRRLEDMDVDVKHLLQDTLERNLLHDLEELG